MNTVQKGMAVAAVAMLGLGDAEADEELGPRQDVALEVYTAPVVKDSVMPKYPHLMQKSGGEGWVQVHFMVDPNGKPYEIMVTDSFGHRSFRRSAVRALRAWTFEPATLDGNPLDAGASRKIVFDIRGSMGASPAFVARQKSLVAAIKDGDRRKADEKIELIERSRLNFYEDAMLALAKYNYHLKWGDVHQRLAALDRAIAHERTPRFLRSENFRAALVARFGLLVETYDFARALDTFEQIEALGADGEDGLPAEQLDALRAAVERIHAFRNDDRAYSVSGEVDDSAHWSYDLFRNDFALESVAGEVAELKLRCERAYVFFRFDPNIRYHVNEEQGDCHLTVVGNPGTTFQLTQM